MAFYVIDGLNICREEFPIRLTGLLSLILALKQRGDDFLCIFDQDAYGIFARDKAPRDLEAKVYREMTNSRSEYSKYFAQIRGKADEKILDLADNNPTYIVVSNDGYQQYRSQYAWLKGSNRSIKGISIFGSRIVCEKLGIRISENKDLVSVWKQLKALLGGQSASIFTPQVEPKQVEPIPGDEQSKTVTKKCPKCGRAFGAELRFCLTDGTSLVEMADTTTTSEDRYKTNIIEPQRFEEPPMQESPILELLKSGVITEEVAEVLQYGIDEQPTQILTDHTEMVALAIVIDKSGSMSKFKQAVIEGQRYMLNALLGASESAYDIRLAQILFNHEIEYFQRFAKFRDEENPQKTHPDVKVLDGSNYNPSGFTALYDAILQGICALTPIIHWANQEGIALETRVGILTDGIDEGEIGSGSKIPPQALKKAIEYMVRKNLLDKIILVGIGNYDYEKVGREIGISQVVSFEADPKSIRQAFELFSRR